MSASSTPFSDLQTMATGEPLVACLTAPPFNRDERAANIGHHLSGEQIWSAFVDSQSETGGNRRNTFIVRITEDLETVADPSQFDTRLLYIGIQLAFDHENSTKSSTATALLFEDNKKALDKIQAGMETLLQEKTETVALSGLSQEKLDSRLRIAGIQRSGIEDADSALGGLGTPYRFSSAVEKHEQPLFVEHLQAQIIPRDPSWNGPFGVTRNHTLLSAPQLHLAGTTDVAFNRTLHGERFKEASRPDLVAVVELKAVDSPNPSEFLPQVQGECVCANFASDYDCAAFLYTPRLFFQVTLTAREGGGRFALRTVQFERADQIQRALHDWLAAPSRPSLLRGPLGTILEVEDGGGGGGEGRKRRQQQDGGRGEETVNDEDEEQGDKDDIARLEDVMEAAEDVRAARVARWQRRLLVDTIESCGDPEFARVLHERMPMLPCFTL